MTDVAQPIVIRRVYNKAGHHGGSWKVAFADFATALMAFFLLMWLIGTATEEQKEGIADYFEDPTRVQLSGGASVSAIDLGGGMDGPAAPELVGMPGPPNILPQDSPQMPPADSASDADTAELSAAERAQAAADAEEADRQRLADLMQLLEDSIASSIAMEPYKDHLLLDIMPQGLRIQIVDQQYQSMFDVGSANLQSETFEILAELGELINSVPNRVSITGHTDARSFNRRDYSNWELSADRANAARRALISGGMDPGKVGQIVGLGSSVPYDRQDPLAPVNRRISIVVLSERADADLEVEAPAASLDALTADGVPQGTAPGLDASVAGGSPVDAGTAMAAPVATD